MQKAIICVDDEKAILWGLQQQIRRVFPDQFLLELAESGSEALEIIRDLQAAKTDIMLVITDEMMPGMKGHELIREINRISPSSKCVLLSGYAAEDVMTPYFTAQVFKFLKKPWEFDELIETINNAIGS